MLLSAAVALADAYRLEPAAKLREFSTYDSIAERRRDLVVFEPGGVWWAQYASYVVLVSDDERDALTAAVRRHVGVVSARETSGRLSFPRLRAFAGEDAAAANREIAARERRLVESGINLTDYRVTEILAAPFSAEDGHETFAQVAFRVVDARRIFSRDCMLFIATRVDKTREWARLAHTPVVLPFRVEAQTRLVTKAELDLVQSVLKSFGKSFFGPVLTGPSGEPLRSTNTLLELKEEADAKCPGASPTASERR